MQQALILFKPDCVSAARRHADPAVRAEGPRLAAETHAQAATWRRSTTRSTRASRSTNRCSPSLAGRPSQLVLEGREASRSLTYFDVLVA